MLGVCVMGLATLLFSKKERIVIVPTGGSPMWIEDTQVSDLYLEKMGTFLAGLWLNKSPLEIDRRNQLVLEYVHPEFYHAAKKQLRQDKESIAKFDQTIFFRTDRAFVEGKKRCYVLEGELITLIGKTGETPSCAQHERKRFSLEFVCQNGKLLLRGIKGETI